jgi:hypothetical protein
MTFTPGQETLWSVPLHSMEERRSSLCAKIPDTEKQSLFVLSMSMPFPYMCPSGDGSIDLRVDRSINTKLF